MVRWPRKSLLRDTRGASMVEFALLAPIFFTILTAILETSVQYFAAQVLESSVNDVSRKIRTGEAQIESWTLQDYKDHICNRLYGLFGECNDMHVDVQQVGSFEDVDYSVPLDLTCNNNCDWTETEVWNPGGSSGVVLVQVYYRYPSMLQLPFASNQTADGRRLLSAATVFQNEPF